MKHIRWSHAEDQRAFTNSNFTKLVKFTHAYCHRRQQKTKHSAEIVERQQVTQQAKSHQITDEHLIDIERIRMAIRKEIDRTVTDFPKDRL